VSTPPPGTFLYHELLTTDVEGGRRFYAELFGWEAEASALQPADGSTYYVLRHQGREQAGLMRLPAAAEAAGARPHWLPYVAVASVDDTAERVTALGGQVVVPPADIPGIGRYVVFTDPAGATIAAFELPSS